MPEMLGGGPLAPVMVPEHRTEQAISMTWHNLATLRDNGSLAIAYKWNCQSDCDDCRSLLYKLT